ncbi:Glu-tRNA(Gln) amidotransferase subunit GatD [Nitrososphaera viennensis]|uniref:Glutamyl-tRNA(Gln) amidotransferase subunit D n=2 Tax=Nitrososphaera viennensis TaxID=1034015 RepID=A0A060HJ55_9ARCH|nr:Glu-tRNA(Gln) amidotransferase subunit GatD [Nitrososphaera viennensis]AIC15558.1 glutamyl-tRNA(Gln) amidotransferase subunit D [Nitrososphaera viennensis EN76]UVS70439.1 Glu-tRNA(Gln) amidotransferase subunit GatD [Nitrososphaera viennensis]
MSSGSYRGAGADLLSRHGVTAGDTVSISTDDGETMAGVIMPRYESASDSYIVIKLKSGYNTGIEVSKIKTIKKIAGATTASEAAAQSGQPLRQQDDNALPKIALISTGGTIASKIDYRTGGVKAALSASELYASVPELASIASVDPEVLMSEYSENINPGHWTVMADKIAEKVRSGKYDGIIVSHGTDTMHYTASALSFALQGLPIPVVLVGAQRSSDRPSSDAALNLIGATTFAAKAPVAGVFVAMHAGTSDDVVAVHVGTRVRKNHTSRRDAFESIDVTPVALVKDGKVEMQQQSGIDLAARGKNELKLQSSFDSRVALVKYHPGFDPTMVYWLLSKGCGAIVFEGTGLGHVNKNLFGVLKEAAEKGVHMFMTSQCIWGRVSMTVYDTGRDLLNIGVVPLSDMISETAVVKAMWALANAQDPEKTMQENLAGEMSSAIPI